MKKTQNKGVMRPACRAILIALPVAQCLQGAEWLRTGSNAPLVTVARQLSVATNASLRLNFNFGFGTDETNAAGVFFDSFSVTLVGQGPNESALLVTLDTSGALWAPANPGGVGVAAGSITRSEIAFDRGNGDFRLMQAYLAAWQIPGDIFGGSSSLFFDLFDNQNGVESLGYFDEITLTGSATNSTPQYGLMSAASPQGPFAVETDYETNDLDQTISIPRVPRRRFYRLQSENECRFKPMAAHQTAFTFPYEFVAPRVSLEKSAVVSGPWIAVTNAVINLGTKSISAPRDPGAQFYRLQGNVRTRILSFDSQGGTLLIQFDFQPAQILLESSAQPGGPFALEQNLEHDTTSEVMRLPRAGRMLFFKLGANDPRELVSARVEGDRIVCGYRMRDAAAGKVSSP